MEEEKTRLEIDDRLSIDVEAEMPRFDDAGVNRPDRNLVDAFSAHLLERKRLALVFKSLRSHGILQQRMVAGRPELMKRKPAQIGMMRRHQTEEIVNLPLEQARQVPT